MVDDICSGRHKRERKQPPQMYTVSERKSLIVEIGSGILLSDYAHFMKGLDKLKVEDVLLHSLCKLLFDISCKKSEMKKNIRSFSGFPSTVSIEEKMKTISKDKKKWTIELLTEALRLFGLEIIGDRDAQIKSLLDYLSHPSILVEEVVNMHPKSEKKSASVTKSKGTKRKVVKSKVTSAYVLFSTATRDEVKEKFPDSSFTFVAEKLNELWKALELSEKQQWMSLALEANYKAIAEEEEESVQQEYEEVDDIDDNHFDADDRFQESDVNGNEKNLE